MRKVQQTHSHWLLLAAMTFLLGLFANRVWAKENSISKISIETKNFPKESTFLKRF